MKPVVLVDYLRLAHEYLDKSGIETARLDAEILLGDVLGMDRMSLYVNFDQPLEPGEVDRFRTALQRRHRGEPVAYITGRREFLRATLAVTPAVLIPRPETELLVEAVLERLPAKEPAEGVSTVEETGDADDRWLQLADVGTGSGAIAIGLAMERDDAHVVALDVSEDALAVARRNAETCSVSERVQFVQGDLLAPLREGADAESFVGRFDAVVSNPPYVATGEWDALPAGIREYEPRVALDGGPDGLDLYRRLVPQAARALKTGGLLALEIGAEQGDAVIGLLTDADAWRDAELLQDYAGRDRFVVARKGP